MYKHILSYWLQQPKTAVAFILKGFQIDFWNMILFQREIFHGKNSSSVNFQSVSFQTKINNDDFTFIIPE